MTSARDERIIRAVLAGNKQAFGELIQAYWGMVYGIAYEYLGDPMLAEDRSQEIFLQAFLNLENLKSPKSFRAWLYGISLNLCKNFLRRQSRSPFFTDLVEDYPNPDSIAEELELRTVLQSAIRQLTEANRQAILLHYYEGFSLNEIAEILCISATAVKGRLHKARQILKAQLQDLFPYQQAKQKGEKQMISVRVVDTPQQIKMNRHGDYYTLSEIILFNDESRRALVIWIDAEQAIAIAQALTKSESEHPLSHDFAAKLLEATGAKLDSILLHRLANQVFFSTVRINIGGEIREIDSRPSDAIALALRLDAAIYVSEELWEKASPPIPQDKSPNGKGIEGILERLDELQNAQKTWIQQKRLEHADKGVHPDENMRRQAREILDAAFS